MQCELVSEFRRKYEGRKVSVKHDRREFSDPQPIVIKGETGKKVASYELDMVR